jgi:hypothetical protein
MVFHGMITLLLTEVDIHGPLRSAGYKANGMDHLLVLVQLGTGKQWDCSVGWHKERCLARFLLVPGHRFPPQSRHPLCLKTRFYYLSIYASNFPRGAK